MRRERLCWVLEERAAEIPVLKTSERLFGDLTTGTAPTKLALARGVGPYGRDCVASAHPNAWVRAEEEAKARILRPEI